MLTARFPTTQQTVTTLPRATVMLTARFPATPLQAVTTLPLLAVPSLIASAELPELYGNYKASGDSLALFFALLLAKRLTLYACALSTVYVASRRSVDAPAGLGERLEQLTSEALYPFRYPEAEQQELKKVVQTLNDTSEATQAATLPLLFGLLLVGAYAANVLLSTPPPPSEADVVLASELVEVLKSVANFAQPLSTASVVLFAFNAELQAFVSAALGTAEAPPTASGNANAMDSSLPTPALATFAAALAGVGAAYLLPSSAAWPLQNVLNSCIGIGVARALQLPSLPAVCAAVVGLTLYDGIGTLGVASAAVAADVLPASSSSSSIMEGVAQARISSAQVWQPGLLTVQLLGRPTDALGLGDVVAPSLVAGWAHRFDQAAGQTQQGEEADKVRGSGGDGGGGGYLGTALGGYFGGCILLEVGPPELTRAALLFLVPSMLVAIVGRLALSGDLPRALAGDGGPQT